MSIHKPLNLRTWAGIVVLIAALVLYLATLDNGLRPDELTGGDLITHQYAQVEARPSNAPGYPLYTMGGWLWFRVGRAVLGWAFNPIQILSLYSTLWAVASLGILYLILLRVTHPRWPLAFLLSLFYAVTYFFWYYSVTTEQYTSAVFQTLLLIWLAFRWDEHPRPAWLLAMALVSGTMLANMLTTLFILPPLLWFIFFRWDSDRRQIFLLTYLKQVKLALAAVGLALLPLLSYAYIYLRGAQRPEWRGEGEWPSAWAWFVQFLTIQQGRDELAPGLTLNNFFTAEFPWLMWQELTWLVFAGGLVGLAFLGRRRAIFLYSTLVIYFIFSWGYRFGNWFQVIIPAYPIFVIGFGAGLSQLLDVIGPRLGGAQTRRYRSALALVLMCLIGLVIYRLATNFARADQSNLAVDTGLEPGRRLLADHPRPPAVISGDFQERVALQYLTTVWKVGDFYPVDAGSVRLPPSAPEANIYISRQAVTAAPDTVIGRHPQAWGMQLIELSAAPHQKLPDTATPSHLTLPAGESSGDSLTLAGWEWLAPAPTWQIALYWQAESPLTADYTMSVRPLAGGQMIFVEGEPAIQDHQPVWNIYPTSRWQPGEIVRDVYGLALPAGVEPDAVQIVVYRSTEAGFENLGEVILPLR